MTKRVVGDVGHGAPYGAETTRWVRVVDTQRAWPEALEGNRAPKIPEGRYGKGSYIADTGRGIRALTEALRDASKTSRFYAYDPSSNREGGTWWPVRLETDSEEEARIEKARSKRAALRAANPSAV